MKKTLLGLLTFFSVLSYGQGLQDLFTQSTEAYKKKDYRSFLDITRKLDSLRPSHPRITYNLASAFAMNGQKEAAISVLENLVLMNSQTVFENDSDFVSLRPSPAYDKLLLLKKEMDQEIKNSTHVVNLEIKDLHPESVLYLEKSNTWLASSIRKRKIVSFDPKTGKCADWLADEGLLSVFALKPDRSENFLWVATSAMPEMERFSKELEGQAEVLKIEIPTRRIVERFTLPGHHVFGDLIVSRSGGVFVSDSDQPVIYKISNGKMFPWLDLNGEAFNLQGLTFDRDEKHVFIADYLKGVLRIPVDKPASRNWLKFPVKTTKKGIDGLVYYQNSLVAVHNGVQPIRIMRYFLDEKGSRIKSSATIDHNRKELNEPALALIRNDILYYFANSPWGAYTKEFNLDEKKYDAPMLYLYPLSR